MYHVLNRANDRAAIFAEARDHAAFLRTRADAKVERPMRLLAYCIVPNHWHSCSGRKRTAPPIGIRPLSFRRATYLMLGPDQAP